jgi:hypothetical protein
MKTHYMENNKAVCGANGYMGKPAFTTQQWYSAIKKCEKCRKIINKRTILI